MSNAAFTKLFNEWGVNLGVNPVLEECIEANNLPAYEVRADGYTTKMSVDQIKAARDYCRKKGLWFKDEGEVSAWLRA